MLSNWFTISNSPVSYLTNANWLNIYRFDTIRIGSNGIISTFSVFTNGSIFISNAKPNDETQYCCTANNTVATAENCTQIIVKGMVNIIKY